LNFRYRTLPNRIPVTNLTEPRTFPTDLEMNEGKQHNSIHSIQTSGNKTMKLFFLLIVLLSFLGKVFADETAPVVSTLYSGSIVPVGIWSDADGNIYGCEPDFHSVFKITSGGVKTDFAGTRGTAGVAAEGVLASNAFFNTPRTVWGDDQFLYVTDSVNNRIRRISWATSLIATIVGGGAGAILYGGVFPGTSVALTLPNAIAGASNGKVYFADFGHVYLLTPETGMVGMVSAVAGGGNFIGTRAFGANVALSDIQGLAVDPTNNFLFVADSGNKVIRKMDLATGHSIIFAGRVKKENYLLPTKLFKNGGKAFEVTFGNPSSVWVNSNGHVFIADSLYHTVSVVRNDKVYLFAGKFQYSVASSGLTTGPATFVHIEASHIFGDSSKGVLFLSDKTRGGIQKINSLAVNNYATFSPTVSPTTVPTASPSTFVPTVDPTYVPTASPSTTAPTTFPTTLNGMVPDSIYLLDSLTVQGTQVGDYASGSLVYDAALVNGAKIVTNLVVDMDGQDVLSLSGDNQYVDVPDTTIPISGLSFASWFSCKDQPYYTRLFDFGNGPGSNNIIFTLGGGGVHVYSSNGYSNMASPGCNNGIWDHVVWTMTYSAGSTSTWTMYLNGVQYLVQTGNVYPDAITLTKNYLGKSNWDVDPNLIGYIARFQMYKTTLTANEVQTVFAGGIPATTPGLECFYTLDSTAVQGTQLGDSATGSIVYDGTALVNGAQIVSTPASAMKGQDALSLNGNNQYIQLPDQTIFNNGLSFAFWFNCKNQQYYTRLLDFGNGAGSNNIIFTVGGSGAHVYSSNGYSAMASPPGCNNGIWCHVVWTMTYSAGTTSTWTMYLNGVQSGVQTGNVYPDAIPLTKNYLGKSNWDVDPYLNGYIARFHMFQNTLTASQVLALFQAGGKIN
jgi:hypothetical protein